MSSSNGGRNSGSKNRKRRNNNKKKLTDEEVLIQFMPFLKADNGIALQIHNQYTSTNDQASFLNAARAFLNNPKGSSTVRKSPIPPVVAARPDPPGLQTQQHVNAPGPQQQTPQEQATAGVASLSIQSDAVVQNTAWKAAPPPLDPAPNQPTPHVQHSSAQPIQTQSTPPPITLLQKPNPLPNSSPIHSVPLPSPQQEQPPQDTSNSTKQQQQPTEDTKKREAPAPKRLWTRIFEQPGRIFVNNVSGEDLSVILNYGPRSELTAHWSLPVSYLQQHKIDRQLRGLTVGLFRRGCTENGQTASIISKSVNEFSFYHDQKYNVVTGRVPFYSPRTPGNVIFRLYNEMDPKYTLAVGPTIAVCIGDGDFTSSVRFILSNFKNRKSNPTSLSSLYSLSIVLQTIVRTNENRPVWGCIQESRKVIEACYTDYVKTMTKLSKLETEVDDMKAKYEDDLEQKPDALYEKIRALMSGKASCERKWRDSQLSFASILRAVVFNPSSKLMLRRDQIARLKLEYQLWCPLAEEFAVPDDNCETWLECLDKVETPGEHFEAYQKAKNKMQERNLGFIINGTSLSSVLYSSNKLNPNAVAVFNKMSGAMGEYYHELFHDEERVVRRRELIRQKTEQVVENSGVFPAGTKVLVFGSSANGFGSPQSDMDMCLHIPDGHVIDEGPMATLSEHLEEAGMVDVDTARLTARIPIVKFNCPDPLSDGDDPELVECDISMHNPLAVLNTSLLRSYAEITPVTRVLASIVKRWAKARDINSPARHTLSSYGYVIMLLHFLTSHKRNGTGLLESLRSTTNREAPILPNLQWLDPRWPTMPKGTPYAELSSMPQQRMKHPMKDHNSVNTYFYKPNSPDERAVLQMMFHGQDLSLSILLASFFRYYAFEFDYKKHVVSLHSTGRRGPVDREVKAEIDGWRNYSAALAIEDPFELEYDVAHVLRGGYYHRIRREFALAYTKIADAASGNLKAWEKGDVQTLSGKELIDWVCEPIATGTNASAAEPQQPSTPVLP